MYENMSEELIKNVDNVLWFFEALTPKDFDKNGKAVIGFVATRNPRKGVPLFDHLIETSTILAKEKGIKSLYAEGTGPKSCDGFERNKFWCLNKVWLKDLYKPHEENPYKDWPHYGGFYEKEI